MGVERGRVGGLYTSISTYQFNIYYKQELNRKHDLTRGEEATDRCNGNERSEAAGKVTVTECRFSGSQV